MILIFISSQQQARRHNIKISLIEQTQEERERNIIFLYFVHFYQTRVRSFIGHTCHSIQPYWRLVNLIDVTLACEDGNSKLVEVVTVVDVDDKDRVSNSLLQIW